MSQCIYLQGNLYDGFKAHGPYNSLKEAEEVWGEDTFNDKGQILHLEDDVRLRVRKRGQLHHCPTCDKEWDCDSGGCLHLIELECLSCQEKAIAEKNK